MDDPTAYAPGLVAQWAAIEVVLTDGARDQARAALRRRGAHGIRPDELVSEAWLRLSRTFAGRTEPYPEWDDDSADRLVARVVDAALVDLLRRARPADVVPVADPIPPSTASAAARVEALDGLRSVIGAIPAAMEGLDCPGCRPEVVAAVAVAVVQRIAAGEDPRGRGSEFDRLLTAALAEVMGVEVAPATMRQRRRRCGPCVRRTIEQAMGIVGYEGS
jgi:hypothetical protein